MNKLVKKYKVMISVCVATYNGEKYIKEQLVSILKQLSDSDEVIVSDDGSSDGTIDSIGSLKDSRIKILENKGEHGVTHNFENALRHVSGDIIFLSDQDDVWVEGKVERCLTHLKDCDMVVHNLRLIDGLGHAINNEFDYFVFRNSAPGFWHNMKKNAYMGSCMAFKRSVLVKSLPFPKHILWHDMWIGLIAAKHGKTKFVDEKLLLYRRHGDNTSTTGSKSKFSKWFQIKYRIQLLWYCLWR